MKLKPCPNCNYDKGYDVYHFSHVERNRSPDKPWAIAPAMLYRCPSCEVCSTYEQAIK